MLVTATPPKVIATTVWRYFRFPLSLLMVEELLAARGITVSYETVCQWRSEVRPRGGRRRSVGVRKVFNGILFVLETGCLMAPFAHGSAAAQHLP